METIGIGAYGLPGSPTIPSVTQNPQLPYTIHPHIFCQTGCIKGNRGVLEVLSVVKEEAGDSSRTPPQVLEKVGGLSKQLDYRVLSFKYHNPSQDPCQGTYKST